MYSSISLLLYFFLNPPPHPQPSSMHCPKALSPAPPALTVGACRSGHGRPSSGQIDTHIIAYQYLLSMRAEMIRNWSCFDSLPSPSASGSGIWLQRASVKLHRNVWKYLSIHTSHMKEGADARERSDYCRGTSVSSSEDVEYDFIVETGSPLLIVLLKNYLMQ